MFDQVHFTASQMQAIIKISVVVAVCMIVMILAYVLYRWKIKADEKAIEDLKSDQIRIQMEALAAEKLAQRKREQEKQKSEANQSKTILKKDEPGEFDDIINEPPLEF
jgi:hypothetical protein